MTRYLFTKVASTGVDDCVPRSIAIATGLKYATVKAALAERSRSAGDDDPRYWMIIGIPEDLWLPYIKTLGFKFAGFGRPPEWGTYLVRQDKHLTCVIDGVYYDTWDCRGRRCLYHFIGKPAPGYEPVN